MILIKHVLLFLVTLYQKVISPLTPTSCRFYPSCSHYAILALNQHNPLKGLSLIGQRLLKCHPFHRGGLCTKGVKL